MVSLFSQIRGAELKPCMQHAVMNRCKRVRLSLEVKKIINSPLNCQLLQFLAARRLEKKNVIAVIIEGQTKGFS